MLPDFVKKFNNPEYVFALLEKKELDIRSTYVSVASLVVENGQTSETKPAFERNATKIQNQNFGERRHVTFFSWTNLAGIAL